MAGLFVSLLSSSPTASAASATLAWDANPGTDNATGYRLYQASGTNAFLMAQTVTNATATVPGLTNGITYRWYVTAINAAGESGPSNTVTNTPNALPKAPSNLNATAISSTRIDLNWQNNGPYGGVLVARQKGSAGESIILAALPGDATTYIDTQGLRTHTTYGYAVAATNAAGLSPWTTAVFEKTLRH